MSTAVAHNNKNSAEPVVVRLDETAASEAKSILFQAYRHEPTFQYLFDHRKPGYEQRVRATLRELVKLYFELNQDVIGVMLDETLVAVGFVGEPDLRLDLASQFNWRLRMILTAGFSSTNRYLDYHRQIMAALPEQSIHSLPLMGVHPKYQNRGFGRLLLETIERLCRDNPRSAGLVLDVGNTRYLNFYESLGFTNIGEIQLGSVREMILFRSLRAGEDA